MADRLTRSRMKDFLARSDLVDHEVLRPLSHIRANWETWWNGGDDIFVGDENELIDLLNQLMLALDTVSPPARYHDNEDRLAEFVINTLRWPIRKQGARWTGADYQQILEQGGFDDLDQSELVQAAAGRIQAAIDRGQTHFDEMRGLTPTDVGSGIGDNHLSPCIPIAPLMESHLICQTTHSSRPPWI